MWSPRPASHCLLLYKGKYRIILMCEDFIIPYSGLQNQHFRKISEEIKLSVLQMLMEKRLDIRSSPFAVFLTPAGQNSADI